MDSRTRALGIAAAAVTIGALGLATAGPAEPDGQILFQPVASVAGEAGDADDALAITACRTTDGGLSVAGRAAGVGNRTVLVDSAGADRAGVRVGVGAAAQFSSGRQKVPGDFAVTLPWATRDSGFVLISGDGTRGARQRCPG